MNLPVQKSKFVKKIGNFCFTFCYSVLIVFSWNLEKENNSAKSSLFWKCKIRFCSKSVRLCFSFFFQTLPKKWIKSLNAFHLEFSEAFGSIDFLLLQISQLHFLLWKPQMHITVRLFFSKKSKFLSPFPVQYSKLSLFFSFHWNKPLKEHSRYYSCCFYFQ